MSANHELAGGIDMENKIASIRFLPARRPQRSGERGGTLLEFAIVMVITFVLIFGIIDFARALYSFHFVSEAAREATRYASVRGAYSCSTSVPQCQASPGDVQNFVMQLVPQGIDGTQVNVNSTWLQNLPMCGANSSSAYPGCLVQVEVDYNFNFIFPANFYNLAPVSFQATQIQMSSVSQVVVSR
jgi:hypothetical protein